MIAEEIRLRLADAWGEMGAAWGVAPAIARVRFLTNTGVTVAHDVIVPPSSHVSIDPATLPGLANKTFSTIVEADGEVHLQLALGESEHAVHALVEAETLGDVVQLGLRRGPKLGAVAGGG